MFEDVINSSVRVKFIYFTRQLLSNHTAKMTKVHINFLKFGMVKCPKTSHNFADIKNLCVQIITVESFHIFLFLI